MARQFSLNATRSDWAAFARWCVGRGETASPAAPASVVDYIQDLVAGNEAATVPRSVAAIRDWHRASGLTTPTDDERVRLALTRAQWHQRRAPGQTVPLDASELASILAAIPVNLVGVRDRALLLVGYVAGLRPSELVSLDVSDLTVVDEGLAVSLMRGRIVIPYGVEPDLCPVLAWQDWEAAARRTGPPAAHTSIASAVASSVASSSTPGVVGSSGSAVTATAGMPRSAATSPSAAAMPGAAIAGTTTDPGAVVGNVRATQSPATPGSTTTTPPVGEAARRPATARAGCSGTRSSAYPGCATADR